VSENRLEKKSLLLIDGHNLWTGIEGAIKQVVLSVLSFLPVNSKILPLIEKINGGKLSGEDRAMLEQAAVEPEIPGAESRVANLVVERSQ
jgi:hypothetical protein